MKITTSRKLDPSLLGERVIREYSYTDSTGESNDGMRRGYSYTVHCKVWGTIENETRNPDGTYTYDYSSRVTNDDYGGGPRKPAESEYDLKNMVEELLFKYNIHEFSTDLQEEPNNIKDYYASIDANASYKKDKEPYFSYSWSTYSKDSKGYTEPDNTIWSSYERLRSESLDDMNEQLNGAFSKDDYILYLMGNEVKKTYRIMFGLDDIGDDETVRDFLSRMKLQSPRYLTFEDAIQNGEITADDIEQFINHYRNINGKNLPHDIIESIFKKNPELIKKFTQSDLPVDLLKRYYPDFDIMEVSPAELDLEDIDAVLEGFRSHYISIFGDIRQQYISYLTQFYDNPEKIRKILSSIDSSKITDEKINEPPFSAKEVQQFLDGIPEEVLSSEDIRNCILENDSILLDRILSHGFEYDESSALKLLHHLENSPKKLGLSQINTVIEIAQQNGISNEVIFNTLEQNGFDIGYYSKDDLERFNQFGISGISLDHVRDSMIREKNFGLITIVDNADEQDVTREYNSLLNELASKKGKRDGNDTKRYEEIFELMCEYSNATELFSRLTPEVKELTKKLMIDNLDVIEALQKNPIGYSSEFSKIMGVMSKSFEISEEDMTNIYMKCLNNGASKEGIISALQQYMPEEERKGFEEKINSANIYPNPKYFWLTDKNLRRIRVNRGENRGTIKGKIQADGRCFSTRVKTDMVGESKEGKKIAVNNLSKWLFGVPGTRGNLTITRAGDYIQLPGNTPDEAVELIETILMERGKEGPSKD